MRKQATLALALLALSACAGEVSQAVDDDDGTVGHVQLPLSTTAEGGHTYVLTNATFEFRGPRSFDRSAGEGDTALDVTLVQGEYQVRLADG